MGSIIAWPICKKIGVMTDPANRPQSTFPRSEVRLACLLVATPGHGPPSASRQEPTYAPIWIPDIRRIGREGLLVGPKPKARIDPTATLAVSVDDVR